MLEVAKPLRLVSYNAVQLVFFFSDVSNTEQTINNVPRVRALACRYVVNDTSHQNTSVTLFYSDMLRNVTPVGWNLLRVPNGRMLEPESCGAYVLYSVLSSPGK